MLTSSQSAVFKDIKKQNKIYWFTRETWLSETQKPIKALIYKMKKINLRFSGQYVGNWAYYLTEIINSLICKAGVFLQRLLERTKQKLNYAAASGCK